VGVFRFLEAAQLKYIGTAFVASTLLIVAWVMYAINDMIPDFAAGAAELLSLAVRACLGTLLLVIVAAVAWFLLRQQYERDRQRDGAFALREYHLEPWTKRAINTLTGKPSPIAVYDANTNGSHAAVIAGGVWTVEPGWGWDKQLTYGQDVERTRRVQAAIAGDAVLGNPFVNLQRGLGGVANAATGRMLAGAYDKPIKPTTIDQVRGDMPQLPAPELDAEDAVQQSTPTQIVMGQTDGGDLVRWEMTQTPHLRFHGMTQGAGKTNAIQTVAAGALANGAHVVVCDRVQFKDWQDFDNRAEFVDTSDPKALADACARLYNIYLGRVEILRQNGAKSVARLQRPPQRIVVVFGEFGAQMASARADGIGGEVEYPLTQLARLAGSTGIHLVAEDQVVKGWPRELIGNMVPVIGRMPAYAGQACGYQGRGGGTDTFPPYTFWYEGAMFRPPHMEPALPSIMARVQPPKALVMLTPAAKVEVEGEESSSQDSSRPVQEPVHSQFTAKTGDTPPIPASVNYPVNTTPTTVEGWYEWTLDNYLPTHLELLQTDDRGRGVGVKALAEAMAAECGKDVDAMKGTASEVAKRLRNEARTTTGDKLGVDTTSISG
jgi:Na+-transporting methylmalonyl-CoA/oxaloacetate decarboxylase gamma subunit